MPENELGTVISTMDGPTTLYFSFVISNPSIRKGQFVKVKSDGGMVLGIVNEITRANRYFERAESVAEYEKTSLMTENFPVSEWEYTVAKVRVQGVIMDTGMVMRSTFPVAPGCRVLEADDGLLKKFLKFDENGLELGTLQNHKLAAKLSMGRLLQKHLAILAMSGSGKSYLMSVLIEELLGRSPKQGRMAVIVLDSHGEYTGFKQTQYARETDIISAKKFKIAFRRVSPYLLAEWVPEMSKTQLRELMPYMESLKREMKNEQKPYSLDDLIARIDNEMPDKKKNVKMPLLAWLYELRSLRLISTGDYPKLSDIVLPGRLTVFDLSEIENAKKKQIMVSYISRRLFKLCKKGSIPPFLLVVEEAHNFAPEKAERSRALAKSPIITIAREGRKFGACLCLISQRPVQLATTALSQCNTNIILRITNPFDIDHVGKSCEGIDRSMLDSITTLRVGEALVVGEAAGAPIFVKIRKRKAEFTSKGKDLEFVAKSFEEKLEKKKQDVEAFL